MTFRKYGIIWKQADHMNWVGYKRGYREFDNLERNKGHIIFMASQNNVYSLVSNLS